jgi:hypothetical protein
MASGHEPRRHAAICFIKQSTPRGELSKSGNPIWTTRFKGEIIMAKYYVQSGHVKLILDAEDARQAAIDTFQWSCDKQTTIHADSPLEHVQMAEHFGWQLDDVIQVSELGFDRADSEQFDTLDIVAAWQGCAFPWG